MNPTAITMEEEPSSSKSLPPALAQGDGSAAAASSPPAAPSLPNNGGTEEESSPPPPTTDQPTASGGTTDGGGVDGAMKPAAQEKGDAKDQGIAAEAVVPPTKDGDNDEGNDNGDAGGTEPSPEEAEAPKKMGRRGRPSGTATTPSTTPTAKRAAEEPEGTSPSPGGVGREKRARKASQTYRPEDFTKVDHSVEVRPGRGKTLDSLASVQQSIERHCKSDPHLAERAHKFVFGGQRKPLKADIQPNLLAFSGYLPPAPEGIDEKELEAMDKKIEVRVGWCTAV